MSMDKAFENRLYGLKHSWACEDCARESRRGFGSESRIVFSQEWLTFLRLMFKESV